MNKNNINQLREKYPKGTRIELTAPLDDPYSPKNTSERATVTGVDDIGNILCKWDSGGSLSLIPEVDSFKIVKSITDTIYEQIMQVREHPDCPNMIDTNAVQRLANELKLYELVIFIEDFKKEYINFILYGKR